MSARTKLWVALGTVYTIWGSVVVRREPPTAEPAPLPAEAPAPPITITR